MLLQLRHLALELLIALLCSSFCLPCHSEPASITMAVITNLATKLCRTRAASKWISVMMTVHSIEAFLAA